jgi:hypothetical protein
VRSASAIAGLLAVLALAGCATTQLQAGRLRLNSARARAAELAVTVRERNPAIRVEDVAIVRGSRGSAVVVRLRNLVGRPFSDLPISIGVGTGGGRRLYLNRSGGLAYFSTHVPLIAARGVLTWVLATGRRLPAATHAFAEVGEAGLRAPLIARALPRILVDRNRDRSPDVLRVRIRNPSSVPQYQLQVYAFARRAGRYVAAGHATVAHLGTGASTALRIRMVGDSARANVAIEALPTIFE